MTYNSNHIFFASVTVVSLFIVSKQLEVKQSSFHKNFQSVSVMKDTQHYHLKDFNKILRSVGRYLQLQGSVLYSLHSLH